ncbi:hypothetical protein KC19_4G179600 [Ceratodon purpureus]|uniref:Uncharacterized protein n=1 Tax=Ceratodon purpureus TaxID=3225 RepID=A0A8T0IC08_CERPU|nr:hypothetical protein KC19_4G179600 [Ceratodon purpureus]
MQSLRGFGAGPKLVAIAIVLLATSCLGQGVTTPPTSRGTGYTASVDLKLPKTSTGRAKAVLESGRFQLWLEGDDLNKCSLSVREKYTGRGAPQDRPLDRGYLLWSANYYSHTPTGADKCTLTFTAQGDLQLSILYKGKTSVTWSSNTAGKGVTKMALETAPDNGNFKLVTASNKAIFQSYNVKEWLVLKGEKFWAGQLLKSPDQVYPDTDTRVLAVGGTYIMAIKGGDLQLLINGPNPQVFWSLKKTSGFQGDLSKVSYAAIVEDDTQGIGLYTSAGKLVYRIAVPPWVPQYGADWHFGIDFYGNLKYYLMYKGASWGYGWQAFDDYCDLPNFCGRYGICTSSSDQFGQFTNNCTGCPSGFKVDSSTKPAGCTRKTSINKCNHTKYLELPGYESAYTFYVTPTRVSLDACKASCSSDCNCDGVFYNGKAGNCFKQSQFLTLKKTTVNTGTVAYIKV